MTRTRPRIDLYSDKGEEIVGRLMLIAFLVGIVYTLIFVVIFK